MVTEWVQSGGERVQPDAGHPESDHVAVAGAAARSWPGRPILCGDRHRTDHHGGSVTVAPERADPPPSNVAGATPSLTHLYPQRWGKLGDTSGWCITIGRRASFLHTDLAVPLADRRPARSAARGSSRAADPPVRSPLHPPCHAGRRRLSLRSAPLSTHVAPRGTRMQPQLYPGSNLSSPAPRSQPPGRRHSYPSTPAAPKPPAIDRTWSWPSDRPRLRRAAHLDPYLATPTQLPSGRPSPRPAMSGRSDGGTTACREPPIRWASAHSQPYAALPWPSPPYPGPTTSPPLRTHSTTDLPQTSLIGPPTSPLCTNLTRSTDRADPSGLWGDQATADLPT